MKNWALTNQMFYTNSENRGWKQEINESFAYQIFYSSKDLKKVS